MEELVFKLEGTPEKEKPTAEETTIEEITKPK